MQAVQREVVYKRLLGSQRSSSDDLTCACVQRRGSGQAAELQGQADKEGRLGADPSTPLRQVKRVRAVRSQV